MTTIDYEQLDRLSISAIWKRRGRDAIFAAYLRGELVATIAAQALELDNPRLVYGEAITWLTRLRGNNSQINDQIDTLAELVSLYRIIDQYKELVLKLVRQNRRHAQEILEIIGGK